VEEEEPFPRRPPLGSEGRRGEKLKKRGGGGRTGKKPLEDEPSGACIISITKPGGKEKKL